MANPICDRRFSKLVGNTIRGNMSSVCPFSLGDVGFRGTSYKTFKGASVGSEVFFPWFCSKQKILVADVWVKCRLNRWEFTRIVGFTL